MAGGFDVAAVGVCFLSLVGNGKSSERLDEHERSEGKRVWLLLLFVL